MAKIYVNLVKQGLWTIEQTPGKWKAEVQELLNKQ